MTLISDTLHYRPDGTVSSVTRVVREEYTTPSGRAASEDVSSAVDLSAVTSGLDVAYAANQARHAELENQIADERDAAAADRASLIETHNVSVIEAARVAKEEKDTLAAQYTYEIKIRDAALAEKDAALADVIAAKDAELADALAAEKGIEMVRE